MAPPPDEKTDMGILFAEKGKRSFTENSLEPKSESKGVRWMR